MQTSVIDRMNLERTSRIDAEFYQTKYLEIERILSGVKNIKPVTKIARVSDGNHMSIADYFDTEGIPYYRGHDITDFFLENNIPAYIPRAIFNTPSMRRSHFSPGDVLVSIVGTIGNISIVPEEMKEATGSCKIAILRPKDIDTSYLAMFLMSKYGNEQIKRHVRGAVQTGLILEDFSQIYVVKASGSLQALVKKCVLKSLDHNRESKSLYDQAEQILLSELGLVGWKLKRQLSFVKNFLNTKSAGRIDAEYFQPKYDEIKAILNRGKCIPIAKCFDIVSGTYFNYVDEGDVGVIKTKQLTNRFISFEVESKTSEKILRDNNLPEIRDKDILFASMGVGSLGKANIYYEFENRVKGKFTIDSTIKIMRQKPNSEIRPELLALYMSSIIGQGLIYQNIVGTSGIISIYKHYLENLPVPVLDRSIQDILSRSVMQAHKSIIKSKKLLDIAKRAVEMAIEQNEEEATRRLNEEVNHASSSIHLESR